MTNTLDPVRSYGAVVEVRPPTGRIAGAFSLRRALTTDTHEVTAETVAARPTAPEHLVATVMSAFDNVEWSGMRVPIDHWARLNDMEHSRPRLDDWLCVLISGDRGRPAFYVVDPAWCTPVDLDAEPLTAAQRESRDLGKAKIPFGQEARYADDEARRSTLRSA